MSRIGKEPIIIPEGVTVKIEDKTVVVSGPKGELKFNFRPEMNVELESGKIIVSTKRNDGFSRALFGTTRNVIANLVTGVTIGFTKNLKIVGTGYRAVIEGENLNIKLGFSHPIIFPVPAGIKIETPEKDTIIVSGTDKVIVGQTAAKIREYYKPEPYKGKGIRYEGEYVRKKAGKTGKAGAAGGAS